MSWSEGIGIELEYMLVDQSTLNVRSIADVVLAAETGQVGAADAEHTDITWSNELVRHVIELKTNGPTRDPLAALNAFQSHICRVHDHASGEHATPLGTAMHPWMNPFTETQLWLGENNEIYEAYNRIFDCRGHGWSNLQSMHLNFPFHDDSTFGSLHAAIRLVLPLLPALAASSPFADGQQKGPLDYRMEVYRHNSARVPSVMGRIIPPPVFTTADYWRLLLDPMIADLSEHDPEGVLTGDWVNSHGAIARFGRKTIEIRVVDVQECPAADMAIAALTVAVINALRTEKWSDLPSQQRLSVDMLADIFERVIVDADQAMIHEPDFLASFGWSGAAVRAGDLWQYLLESLAGDDPVLHHLAAPLEVIREHGPLARRMIEWMADRETSRDDLIELYRLLNECLLTGEMF